MFGRSLDLTSLTVDAGVSGQAIAFVLTIPVGTTASIYTRIGQTEVRAYSKQTKNIYHERTALKNHKSAAGEYCSGLIVMYSGCNRMVIKRIEAFL